MIVKKRGPKRSDKVDRIKAAATELFARFGYRKTSVDDIVKEAGVSKGLFYHYYSDKKDLYLALYEEYASLISSEVNERVDTSERDFLQRILQITILKIKLMEQRPALFSFLNEAYYEANPDVASEINSKNLTLIEANRTTALSNIDRSLFSASVDFDKAVNLVIWAAEGFVKHLSQKESEVDPSCYREFETYLDLIRDGVYREEVEDEQF